MADKRADRVWLRLVQSYGVRVAQSYGDEMPRPWVDAIADLSDEQLAYGLRKVIRESPIHPPALGQFVACCVDMPQASAAHGPTIQEQLCSYASLKLRATLDPLQYCLPWTYLYREWIDPEKPKHLQRQAECTGVMIPPCPGHDAYRLMAADMVADKEGHSLAMRCFRPGPPPSAANRKVYASIKHGGVS